MTEKFSVIIPLYNKGLYIASAIESVLKQTVKDFEIIVIDGRSEDNGPKIVKEFDEPRIHFLVQSGKGVSNARNEAVHFSKNNYIAFLDADDEWMPHHLETIRRLIKKYPEAGMFATAWKIYTGEGTLRLANLQYIPPPPWEGILPDYFRSGALGEDPVLTSVVVIPREIFHEMGGFKEGYWYGEDTDLFGKIALKYPVAFSWEIGGIYHTEAINRAGDKKMPLDYAEPFVKTARLALMKEEVPQELKESLHEFIAKKEFFRCYFNLHEGNLRTAQTILRHCTTKLRKNEKMKLLILTKLPSPVYFFLRDIKRELITYNSRLPFKKKETSFDISRRKIFTDIDNQIKLFESEKKEFFERRNVWLKEHPEYSHLYLRQFDTHAYSCENVLVISPHPDDEIIGCGGTLIRMLKEGANVSVVQLTDGSNSCALKDVPQHIKKTIRLEEAKVVATNLGFSELFLFKEIDSHLTYTGDNVKKLSDLLNRLHPKVIFVPFINDKHPDHVVANEILSKSLESSTLNLSGVNVLSYEVWNFVPPNSFCIIDNQFDKKSEMLMKYPTAMKVVDYVHSCESLNSYHAYNLFGKKGFAEVFLDIDAKTYMKLIRDTNIS